MPVGNAGAAHLRMVRHKMSVEKKKRKREEKNGPDVTICGGRQFLSEGQKNDIEVWRGPVNWTDLLLLPRLHLGRRGKK